MASSCSICIWRALATAASCRCLTTFTVSSSYPSGNNLVKPPWVSVQQTGNERCDRCTLCKSRKGGLVCCNDGHLQSAQHTKNVVEWFKLYEFRCLSSGACAAGASTPSSPATASTVAPAPQVPPGVWNMEWGDSWGMEWRSPPPRLSGGGMSMLDHLSAQEPVLLREAEDDCVATPIRAGPDQTGLWNEPVLLREAEDDCVATPIRAGPDQTGLWNEHD